MESRYRAYAVKIDAIESQNAIPLRLLDLLAGQIPVVQVANARAEIGSKAQPAEIGNLKPGSDGVNQAVEISEVGIDAEERDDIDGSLNWTVKTKEERSPDEVEAKLDGVEGHGMSGRGDVVGGVEGRETDVGDTIGGVTHGAVENGPDRTKEPWWRVN